MQKWVVIVVLTAIGVWAGLQGRNRVQDYLARQESRLRADLIAEQGDLRSRVAVLSERREAMQALLDGAQTRLERIEAELAIERAAQDPLRDQLRLQHAEVLRYEARLAATKTELADTLTQLNETLSQLNETRSTLAERTQDRDRLRTRQETLVGQLAERDQNLKTLQGRLEDAESRARAATQQVTQLTDTAETLQSKLDVALQTIALRESERDSALKQVEALQQAHDKQAADTAAD